VFLVTRRKKKGYKFDLPDLPAVQHTQVVTAGAQRSNNRDWLPGASAQPGVRKNPQRACVAPNIQKKRGQTATSVASISTAKDNASDLSTLVLVPDHMARPRTRSKRGATESVEAPQFEGHARKKLRGTLLVPTQTPSTHATKASQKPVRRKTQASRLPPQPPNTPSGNHLPGQNITDESSLLHDSKGSPSAETGPEGHTTDVGATEILPTSELDTVVEMSISSIFHDSLVVVQSCTTIIPNSLESNVPVLQAETGSDDNSTTICQDRSPPQNFLNIIDDPSSSVPSESVFDARPAAGFENTDKSTTFRDGTPSMLPLDTMQLLDVPSSTEASSLVPSNRIHVKAEVSGTVELGQQLQVVPMYKPPLTFFPPIWAQVIQITHILHFPDNQISVASRSLRIIRLVQELSRGSLLLQ
jgi:hypothetical protein